jgi:pheophorbide a oxygenase
LISVVVLKVTLLLMLQGDGKCTAIPQALDATSAATACASRRSCATALPTAVGAGLLWVWPDAAPTAAQDAAATGERCCLFVQSNLQLSDGRFKAPVHLV